MILPEGATFLKELEAEAKFYQIQGILDELKPETPKHFEESVILTNEDHRRVLKGWLPSQEGKIWCLLFRVSRDGFAAATFHSKCENRGRTVTIVKSGNNIFGGFIEQPWTSTGNAQSNRSFNIPPGQPAGHLNFWKIQISPSPGQKVVQMPDHMSISGDQFPPFPRKLPNSCRRKSH